LAVIGTNAAAQPLGDFGKIEICSKLTSMPEGYAEVDGDCDKSAPLERCLFTYRGDSWPIIYLVANGEIWGKFLPLRSQKTGPFGLLLGEREANAASKFMKATGFTLTRAVDNTEPDYSYLQTEEMEWKGNQFASTLVFINGKLQGLSIMLRPPLLVEGINENSTKFCDTNLGNNAAADR
jgi:hypothetical protein